MFPPSASKATRTVVVGNGAACIASEYAKITSVVASRVDIMLENISAPERSTILLNPLKQGCYIRWKTRKLRPLSLTLLQNEQNRIEVTRLSAQRPTQISFQLWLKVRISPSWAQLSTWLVAIVKRIRTEKVQMGVVPSSNISCILDPGQLICYRLKNFIFLKDMVNGLVSSLNTQK